MSRQLGRFLETVGAVVAGILIVRKLDAWGIDPLGPAILWGSLALIAVALASGWFSLLRNGRNGLDQWPNPHGRYYDEWSGIPATENTGDYYAWLA